MAQVHGAGKTGPVVVCFPECLTVSCTKHDSRAWFVQLCHGLPHSHKWGVFWSCAATVTEMLSGCHASHECLHDSLTSTGFSVRNGSCFSGKASQIPKTMASFRQAHRFVAIS